MRQTSLIFFLLLASSAQAQESQLQADFRHEKEALRNDCSFSFKGLGSCAYDLFTDHPMHIALGSIAPQNGMGVGLAFLTHWTPNERWRLSWNADAVGSSNASWRAGVYMKAVYIPREKIIVVNAPPTTPLVHEYPVFNAYAQAISLNTLTYFGLGPSTSDVNRSYFGMRETITGVNAIVPVYSRLKVSLFGEVNGRFVELRGSHGQSSPSIEQLYTEATAPGLINQPPFVQFGEGIRLRPAFLADHIQLNYSGTFQQYLAPGKSLYSFRRYTIDLSHQFPLYRTMRSQIPKDFNGPDDCSEDASSHKCPGITRNLEGSIGLRMLIIGSISSAGHVVPFYFQPTLGGSDVNGSLSLSSYQDYRFRGPSVFLLRGSFEHSIYGPLGFAFMADEGKVTQTRGDIGFQHLSHSFSAGLTLRAGGFPQVSFLFAWGGHEGTHTTANINPALLGGTPRPSLY